MIWRKFPATFFPTAKYLKKGRKLLASNKKTKESLRCTGKVEVTTHALFREQILRNGNCNNLHAFRCISTRCHEQNCSNNPRAHWQHVIERVSPLKREYGCGEDPRSYMFSNTWCLTRKQQTGDEIKALAKSLEAEEVAKLSINSVNNNFCE